MKSEKGQSLVMVGVALFLLAGLCLYLGLSQPKISSGVLVETPTTAVQSGTTTRSAAATVGRSAASSTATAAQTTASGNAGTVSYPVNLNTATFEELTAIQGIGDQRAAAILAYREQIGKYTSVEQIKDIRGIGDGLYAKIYEDWAAGRITEYNFNMLSEKYQGEQKELDEKIQQLHEAMEAVAQTAVDAEKWVGLMRQYVNPTELTAELLNTLIEKIFVHEAVKGEDGSREQEVEIFYRFIGKID